ncbi:LuxR C-terminal-related transcriptional regulator [Emcibacter sp. SYSU 3D8]|uniref:LuxR C-terminal-related transcriptional regulator n=1 Tax=Emcibacter sp. SYSU 3D8 TaxID=3133969 RepID=UPI0031FE78CE
MAAGESDPLASLLRTLERTRDTEQAVEIAKDIGAVIGLPYPSCIADYSDPMLTRAPDGRTYAELFGWGADFREDWERNRLNLISPIANVCRYSTRPFVWRSKDIVTMSPLTSDTRGKHWHLTPERQIAGGLTIPVHLPLGRVASMSWVARTEARPFEQVLEDYSTQLRLAAILFLDIVAQQDMDAPTVTAGTGDTGLSAREVECLSWVALGKTDGEIATIINRSVPTVRFHLENAMKKLNVHNRTQAAALAAQAGILGSLLQ